jgi:hypothetical protein
MPFEALENPFFIERGQIMNLRHYRDKIKAIEKEMEDVKRHTTPEIEQSIQRSRELRENWARCYLCPTLNRLEAGRQQILRLMEMERKRLGAKKPAFSESIQTWFQNYSRTHDGRYRIRAVGSSEEWVILTKLSSHGRPTEHLAYRVSEPEKTLFIRQGRLSNSVLGEMIQAIEATLIPLDEPDTAGTGLIDSEYHPATKCASQAP